jgi:hypothetical protein
VGGWKELDCGTSARVPAAAENGGSEGVAGGPGFSGFNGNAGDVSFWPAASGAEGKMAAGVGFRGCRVWRDGGSVRDWDEGSGVRDGGPGQMVCIHRVVTCGAAWYGIRILFPDLRRVN